MTKLNSKLRHRASPTSDITRSGETNEVYSLAYLQARPQAYPQALPDFLYVGGSGCGHADRYFFHASCALCFLKYAFEGEIPGQLHLSKTLTDNGNPQQTPKFISHVQVIEGFKPPTIGENLRKYRLARKQYTAPAHKIFPVSSALWELMGYQPPLARPLILLVSGYSDRKIAEIMGISIYNLHERLFKGVKLTLQWMRL